jgi:hypothetical protein
MQPRIFSEPEAHHFCSTFSSSTGASQDSIDTFQQQVLGQQRTTISEGSATFNEFRDCALRETERLLFLSVSHYRRSLDLMIASASPWLHVTLYYGSWFTARALLSMFGCTVLQKVVIDVDKSNPGNQELLIRRIGNGTGQISTTYYGSHQKFWYFFYEAVKPLRGIVGARLSPSLIPIQNDPTWFIKMRNRVNYTTTDSMSTVTGFINNFSSNSFPQCLSGPLATQYGVFELLLELTFSFAKNFNIHTDALANLPTYNNLSDTIQALIYNKKVPGLVRKTIKPILTSN